MINKVNVVADIIPQIIALARGAQLSECPPQLIAIGMRPPMVVRLVRMIGLNLSMPASTTEAYGLAPLALAGAVTGASMVLIGLPLNFFNVVVVPLLLGAGVDSGIHLVEQSRRRKPEEVEVLGTTTARAVLFSALTTITSFGTLGFSSHVGLSGLGTLLTVGMSLTVISNLIVLPALLEKFWQSPADSPIH